MILDSPILLYSCDCLHNDACTCWPTKLDGGGCADGIVTEEELAAVGALDILNGQAPIVLAESDVDSEDDT